MYVRCTPHAGCLPCVAVPRRPTKFASIYALGSIMSLCRQAGVPVAVPTLQRERRLRCVACAAVLPRVRPACLHVSATFSWPLLPTHNSRLLLYPQHAVPGECARPTASYGHSLSLLRATGHRVQRRHAALAWCSRLLRGKVLPPVGAWRADGAERAPLTSVHPAGRALQADQAHV